MTSDTSVVAKPQLSILASELSEVERKLCEVLISNPGIQFKDAGTKAGYSAKTAGPSVTRALKRPEVQAYLQALKYQVDNPGERKIRRKVMKAREVLWRLSQIGRASLKPHLEVNADGEVIGTKVDLEHADTLRELTFTKRSGGRDESAWTEESVKAKVADPLPALVALQKYHGLEKHSAQAPTVNLQVFVNNLPDGEREEFKAKLRAAWEVWQERKALGDGGGE